MHRDIQITVRPGQVSSSLNILGDVKPPLNNWKGRKPQSEGTRKAYAVRNGGCMKRLSWKYMAGLIDGEGCIDMQHHRHKRDGQLYCTVRLRITLTQDSGLFLLKTARENFGGCMSVKMRSKENRSWSDAHCWSLHGKLLRPLLQNIVSHLVIKKEQAKLAIWWLDNMAGRHVPEKIREDAINEFKRLKRDPQRLSEEAIEDFRQHVRHGKSWERRAGERCVQCGKSLNVSPSGLCYLCYNKSKVAVSMDAIVQPHASMETQCDI